MSSSTITVKPKRRSARSPLPSADTKPISQGTVLLRNPLPKYSFQVPKAKSVLNSDKQSQPSENLKAKSDEASKKQLNMTVTDIDALCRIHDSLSAAHSGETAETAENPAAGSNTQDIPEREASSVEIGKIVHSYAQAYGLSPPTVDRMKVTNLNIVESVNSCPGKSIANQEPLENDVSTTVGKQGEKPVNVVDPFSSKATTKLTHSCSESAIVSSSSTPNVENKPQIKVPSSNITPQTGATTEVRISKSCPHNSLPSQTSKANMELTNQQQAVTVTCPGMSALTTTTPPAVVCDCSEKMRKLEEEKQLLKSQLAVQIQVNQELKKLLVASIGDDLQHRVEMLMTDKAQLSLEVGDYSKRVTEDYETLDKVSIQADMWRTKYMASRVMSDEMAAARAFYSMQYQEGQMALQQLLTERHELRASLYEAYRGLQQIKGAFDPLNSENSTKQTLSAHHVLELARSNQQLVEAIKYRLLPSHVTSSLANKMEPDWCDYLTKAESHAQELLSREVRPEDFRHLVPSKLCAPTCMTVDRYHPLSQFDNLTINVCCQCKGEISIV